MNKLKFHTLFTLVALCMNGNASAQSVPKYEVPEELWTTEYHMDIPAKNSEDTSKLSNVYTLEKLEDTVFNLEQTQKWLASGSSVRVDVAYTMDYNRSSGDDPISYGSVPVSLGEYNVYGPTQTLKWQKQINHFFLFQPTKKVFDLHTGEPVMKDGKQVEEPIQSSAATKVMSLTGRFTEQGVMQGALHYNWAAGSETLCKCKFETMNFGAIHNVLFPENPMKFAVIMKLQEEVAKDIFRDASMFISYYSSKQYIANRESPQNIWKLFPGDRRNEIAYMIYQDDLLGRGTNPDGDRVGIRDELKSEKVEDASSPELKQSVFHSLSWVGQSAMIKMKEKGPVKKLFKNLDYLQTHKKLTDEVAALEKAAIKVNYDHISLTLWVFNYTNYDWYKMAEKNIDGDLHLGLSVNLHAKTEKGFKTKSIPIYKLSLLTLEQNGFPLDAMFIFKRLREIRQEVESWDKNHDVATTPEGQDALPAITPKKDPK